MQSWVAEVRHAAHQLKDAKAEATDEDIILVLTQGLPITFENFVVSLDTTASSDLTLNYIISCLLNEEARQKVKEMEPFHDPHNSAMATTSQHRSPTLNITCYKCGKRGHYQKDCTEPSNCSHCNPPPATTKDTAETLIALEDEEYCF